MSTLRINNIEAQSVPASPTIDEKVKVTNSSGDILVNIDGKTSGITTIGINTTDGNIKFDANSNVLITGILTATNLAGNFTPDSLEIGSNIKLGNAGVITATTFKGDGDFVELDVDGHTELDNINISGVSTHVGLSQFQNTINLTHASAGQNYIYFNEDLQFAKNGTGTRLKIDSSGKVNIGNTGSSWVGPLSIGSGASGQGQVLQLYSNSDTYGAIFFGDTDSGAGRYVGDISYYHDNNYMRFSTAGAERLRISSNGNVSLGLGGDAVPTSTAYNGGTLHIHQATSGSNGAQLKMTTAAGGSAAGDGFYIAHWGGNNETFIYNKEATNMRFGTNSAERLIIKNDGDLEITDGNLIVAPGHGIDFSDSSNASGMSSELLDDYEEGSFTPTYSNTGGVTPNYNYQEGFYTKIGNLVTCAGIIGCTNANSFGSGKRIQIQLPFTCANNSYGLAGGGLADGKGFQNVFSGNTGVGVLIGGNTNYGRLVTLAASPSNVYYTGTPGLQNDHYFRFRYIYHVS